MSHATATTTAKSKGATTMTTKKNNVGFQTLALTDIYESSTNPRRTFDESKLAELADFVSGHKTRPFVALAVLLLRSPNYALELAVRIQKGT
jgi:hypothetical protein